MVSAEAVLIFLPSVRVKLHERLGGRSVYFGLHFALWLLPKVSEGASRQPARRRLGLLHIHLRLHEQGFACHQGASRLMHRFRKNGFWFFFMLQFRVCCLPDIVSELDQLRAFGRVVQIESLVG